MKRMEGFHTRTAWRMAAETKLQLELDGTWVYRLTEDVLEEISLYHILHYIKVQCQTITVFIINRPMSAYCDGREIKRRSCPSPHFWWEQLIDLDMAGGAVIAVSGIATFDEDLVDSAGSE